MRYNFQSKAFTISENDLHLAALNGLYAIQRIRVFAGTPLTKTERTGALSDVDHAEKAVIDALKAIGIDLGADWGHELDVTKIG